MLRTRMSFLAFLAAVFLAVNACVDRALLTDPEPTGAGTISRTVFAPDGTACVDEDPFIREGHIDITPTQMTFKALSRNNCWDAAVGVQANLHWGVVSHCLQDVPLVVIGYGHPNHNNPDSNFYENPAIKELEVIRTKATPSGGKVKAEMRRLHRFWETEQPYGTVRDTFPNEITVVCWNPDTTVHVPPLNLSVTGPSSVDQAGEYQYSASASGGGGVGTYSYQWSVASGGGSNWSTLGTDTSQIIQIDQGSGDVRMRVVVTSGNQTAEEIKFTRNDIGQSPPPEECVPNPPYTECPL